MSEVLERVRDWLHRSGVAFVEKHHEPTFTSEESARARGESLRIGAKALVVKVDDAFRLLVLPADRKLDSAAVKRHFSAKKLRFADAAELLALTGLIPGSVPPFGPPILDLPLIADETLLESEKLAFNAGSLTDSIILASVDYKSIAGASWSSISIRAPVDS
jgi:prolyl-tRNA editing enzyme YbaK/EbsC (Cys-tRNA(Pro) deacylase)